jgi:hypothetical protein
MLRRIPSYGLIISLLACPVGTYASGEYKQHDIASVFENQAKTQPALAKYNAKGTFSIPEILVNEIVVMDSAVCARVEQEKTANQVRLSDLENLHKLLESPSAQATYSDGTFSPERVVGLKGSPLYCEENCLYFSERTGIKYVKRSESIKSVENHIEACRNRQYDSPLSALSFETKKALALDIYQQRVATNMTREQFACLLRVQSASAHGTKKIQGLEKTGFELLEQFFAAKTVRSLLKRGMLETLDKEGYFEAAKAIRKTFSVYGREAQAKNDGMHLDFLTMASRLCLFDWNTPASQKHAVMMYHLYKYLGVVLVREVMPALTDSTDFESKIVVSNVIIDSTTMVKALSTYLSERENKWRQRLIIDQTAIDMGTASEKAPNLVEALTYYSELAGITKK